MVYDVDVQRDLVDWALLVGTLGATVLALVGLLVSQHHARQARKDAEEARAETLRATAAAREDERAENERRHKVESNQQAILACHTALDDLANTNGVDEEPARRAATALRRHALFISDDPLRARIEAGALVLNDAWAPQTWGGPDGRRVQWAVVQDLRAALGAHLRGDPPPLLSDDITTTWPALIREDQAEWERRWQEQQAEHARLREERRKKAAAPNDDGSSEAEARAE